MTDTPFSLQQDGPIARLTLCRPQKRNAMNGRFWRDLPPLVQGLSDAGKTRVLVIDAQGPHFTAGLDLALFASMQGGTDTAQAREAFAHRLAQMQSGFDALEAARFPVIAAIQGGCIGGGVDMVCACDIRLSTRDAFFRIEEINVGMMADLGTLQRLPKALPAGVVRKMAYAGSTLDAVRAHGLGFVNALYDTSESLCEGAMALAQTIAQKPPLAIAASKDCLNHARDHGVAQSLRYMRAVQAGVFSPGDILHSLEARAKGEAAQYADLAPLSPKTDS